MKITMQDIAEATAKLSANNGHRRIRTNDIAIALGVDPRTVNRIVARNQKESAMLKAYGIVFDGKFIAVISNEKKILAQTPESDQLSQSDMILAVAPKSMIMESAKQ
jgi:hypothetical protein